MSVLWPLEAATAAKHRLYRRYLSAWWPKMLQSSANGYVRPKVTYVDAFAGPGRYEGGEPGSPIFALHDLLHHTARDQMRLSRDRVRLVFIERDRARYEHLSEEVERKFGNLSELPVHVDIRNGEAGEETASALTDGGCWKQPILSIFDSWGNVNVPLSLVKRIARNPSSEVITTLGPNWFSRREGENPDQLDTVFGGREYWTPADKETRSDERWRVWLATYRDALGRAGFQYRLQFCVVPKTGMPLYLVYGTGHPSGVEAMKDAMWTVDGKDGMRFQDPRTRGASPEGQLTLWGGGHSSDPELLELVTQRVQEGAVSLGDLRRWLLCETSRWRKRDARPAINELLEGGQIRVEPHGRLTNDSVIRQR